MEAATTTYCKALQYTDVCPQTWRKTTTEKKLASKPRFEPETSRKRRGVNPYTITFGTNPYEFIYVFKRILGKATVPEATVQFWQIET